MAAGLHGSARTTPRIRAELQAAQAPARVLAARYGLNPKTVAKWRKRTTTADAPMGPRRPRSTVLAEAEEAIVVEFRRRTLLPLDDVLGCLRETIPRLSRSALHRCLVRHGISRLPEGEEKASKRRRFAETTLGYVHIDVCELRLSEGKLFMFLAIDRVTKFVHVAFLDANTKLNGAAFLREVIRAFPYRIHTVLTDNGVAFAPNASTRWDLSRHIFDRVCDEHGIEHKLTKPYHPWTNGQAERMNRTVKEATIKAFHYPGLEALKAHVLAFVTAYNFGKHLKALRWRTPFQAICDAWTKDPSVFKIDPHHLIPGPYTLGAQQSGGPAPPARLDLLGLEQGEQVALGGEDGAEARADGGADVLRLAGLLGDDEVVGHGHRGGGRPVPAI
jgi:transposase InsO family protein